MVFHDLVDEEPYDLWIGDEAWELDYYLHENPEQKRAAYAWLTDFVGWLPMPDGGEREAFLTADYNAEMIEHIARYPRVRDRAIFVGAPDDIVPDRFGPGLPPIRELDRGALRLRRRLHHRFDPADLRRPGGDPGRARLPAQTTGVHRHRRRLGRRRPPAAAGHRRRSPQAQRAVPGLRMIVVAGPRIDPRALPARDGVEIRPTCTTCTGTWPPAIWPSSRAG